MAYDEKLANRVRAVLASEADLTEKRMFGGLAFLIDGKMALTISHRGGLMVRTDPAGAEELIATTNARQIEMRGRPMPGWLHIEDSDIRTARQLVRWVRIASAFTRSVQQTDTTKAAGRARSAAPKSQRRGRKRGRG
jgi:TfoX/Sxy family transcriptional regulator of competence genes